MKNELQNKLIIIDLKFKDMYHLALKFFYYILKINIHLCGKILQTISAVGANASLPHYHLNDSSCKKLFYSDDKYSSYYLLDSGGHYRDGTTDVTRTTFYGTEPDYHFKKMFTLVLRGHIDCATLNFPENVNGYFKYFFFI